LAESFAGVAVLGLFGIAAMVVLGRCELTGCGANEGYTSTEATDWALHTGSLKPGSFAVGCLNTAGKNGLVPCNVTVQAHGVPVVIELLCGAAYSRTGAHGCYAKARNGYLPGAGVPADVAEP
jgi:hypothetical protein